MLPSTDYIGVGISEKTWLRQKSLIETKLCGPDLPLISKEEEDLLQSRQTEKPGNVPLKKHTFKLVRPF